MNKGVAIPYVVSIILAVVVIAIVSYWFFITELGGSGTGTKATCDSKVLSYCQSWQSTSWQIKPVLQSWDVSCGPEPKTPKDCSVKIGLQCDCATNDAECTSKGYTKIYKEPASQPWPGCGTFCCK